MAADAGRLLRLFFIAFGPARLHAAFAESMITRDHILGVLTDAFPDFTPDPRDSDIPYVVLGDFANYLMGVYKAGSEEKIRRAVELIERLHTEGDPYVKEAATIGLLEGIQNTWGDSGIDPEAFGMRLLPKSRGWWNSLNKFWQKEIPYVGADLKTESESGRRGDCSPRLPHHRTCGSASGGSWQS